MSTAGGEMESNQNKDTNNNLENYSNNIERISKNGDENNNSSKKINCLINTDLFSNSKPKTVNLPSDDTIKLTSNISLMTELAFNSDLKSINSYS